MGGRIGGGQGTGRSKKLERGAQRKMKPDELPIDEWTTGQTNQQTDGGTKPNSNTGSSIWTGKKCQAFPLSCFFSLVSVVWKLFSFVVLYLTFFVSKFYWSELNTLSTTSI